LISLDLYIGGIANGEIIELIGPDRVLRDLNGSRCPRREGTQDVMYEVVSLKRADLPGQCIETAKF
jgi:hypothetical protein